MCASIQYPLLLQGKVTEGDACLLLAGITPAHAGKSASVSPGTARLEDHPRPCGEKLARWLSVAISLGSPPPMRGKGG